MTATASATAEIFWRSIASASHEPIPGNRIVTSPTEIASDATTKNQPPDIDIIVFQMRPGAAKGTSRRQNDDELGFAALGRDGCNHEGEDERGQNGGEHAHRGAQRIFRQV